MFFITQAINDWSSLSNHVVNAETLAFINRMAAGLRLPKYSPGIALLSTNFSNATAKYLS